MAEQKMEFCKRCRIPKNLCPKVCNVKIVEAERKMILPQGTILHQDYQIYGVLGAGGMSVTYCACTKLKPVVLKQFNPTQANRKVLDMEKEREKFGEEARKLLQLDHPNIVHIENIIEDEAAKNVFLVMELLRGITLEEYLQKKGRIEEQEAYEMLTPIFHALETVHKEHLVYRDVKPSNIMVCDDGTMKLIDFGSARDENNDTKTALLTEGYAPPEQYNPYGNQGPWTDVYALCATLYRMITGKKPKTSLLRYQKDELEIPESLKCIEELKKGLALEVEDRWQTVEELQAALGISRWTENIKYAAKKSLKKAAEVAGEKIVEGFEFDRVQVDTDKSESCQRDASWGQDTELLNKEEQETEYVPRKIRGHNEDVDGANEELPDEDTISEESIDSGCEEKTRYFDVDKKSTRRVESHYEENANKLRDDSQNLEPELLSYYHDKENESMSEMETQNGKQETVFIPNKGILTRCDVERILPVGQTEFTIPYGITRIDNDAFRGYKDLIKICIPDSVTSIGDNAFANCHNLRDMDIPDSVKTIGNGAFFCCSKLIGKFATDRYQRYLGQDDLMTGQDVLLGDEKKVTFEEHAADGYKDCIMVSDLHSAEKRENKIEKLSEEQVKIMYQRGDACYSRGDMNEAFSCYYKAACAGHAISMYMLGICFRYGKGTPQDEKQALYWYEEAARKGVQFRRMIK